MTLWHKNTVEKEVIYHFCLIIKDTEHLLMKNKIPPKRKHTSEIIGDRPYMQGDKEFLRRDYADGSVDLITYDENKHSWLYETYAKKEIPGMDYDFEYCLSVPYFAALYFISATMLCGVCHKSIR